MSSRLSARCPDCGSTAYSDGEFRIADDPCDNCMGRMLKTGLDLSKGMEHKRRALRDPREYIDRPYR